MRAILVWTRVGYPHCPGSLSSVVGQKFWEANSKEGLNLIVWEGFPRQGFDHRSELYQKLVTSFIEVHRGLFWREAITAQCETAQRLDWAVGAGGMLWDPGQSRYLGSPDRKAEEIIRAPHIVGLTREIELARPGSWVGALFHYHPPCIDLSRSEQRLLLAALAGMTDEELSSALGVSVPAVKKTWLSIYRRFAEHRPEVVPDEQPQEEQRGRRGKEKRRRVLSYLREHPEELQMGSQRIPKHSMAQRKRLPRVNQLS